MVAEPAAELTAADRAHFETLLRGKRRDLELELGRQGDSLDAVRAARSGGDADDEHDPEGPTLSDEWSLRSGVHAELAAALAAIDAALARIDDGSYGRCLRRGEPIGRGRLEARPAAELCIDCAREP
ncbi:TraR/DksA C4-type zinc finger protein [Cryobacterium sp.]|jgi:DnaK suppressor protein|uniref:TraR/DksA family transcriptional regulator n=1 Tax=Cryobacterium sp. TaxID=1926290 RepID=UPI0026193AD7|nr:TraR/DksA C4-type zinc finger protein [Cryobacterium sp.]MCU1446138.1 hypothetical protein [Cryobacterium sp.]